MTVVKPHLEFLNEMQKKNKISVIHNAQGQNTIASINDKKPKQLEAEVVGRLNQHN